jgi:hypothetical protein
MARKKQRKSKTVTKKKTNRNFVVVAMNKRYKSKSGPMKDKRLKRKNRNTWKGEDVLE